MSTSIAEPEIPETARRYLLQGIAKAISEEQFGGALNEEVLCAYRWFELCKYPALWQESDFILLSPVVAACTDLTIFIEDSAIRRWYALSRKPKAGKKASHAWNVFIEMAEKPFWVRLSREWFIPEQLRGKRLQIAVMSMRDAVSPMFEDTLAARVQADRLPVAWILRTDSLY